MDRSIEKSSFLGLKKNEILIKSMLFNISASKNS